jgi:hypothetical protein
MRPQSHQHHVIKGVTIVPVHEIGPYIAVGWRLTDEPSCGGARMVPLPRFERKAIGGVSRETYRAELRR